MRILTACLLLTFASSRVHSQAAPERLAISVSDGRANLAVSVTSRDSVKLRARLERADVVMVLSKIDLWAWVRTTAERIYAITTRDGGGTAESTELASDGFLRVDRFAEGGKARFSLYVADRYRLNVVRVVLTKEEFRRLLDLLRKVSSESTPPHVPAGLMAPVSDV
jgi:hypothetical protein